MISCRFAINMQCNASRRPAYFDLAFGASLVVALVRFPSDDSTSAAPFPLTLAADRFAAGLTDLDVLFTGFFLTFPFVDIVYACLPWAIGRKRRRVLNTALLL
jgi:hypothetical protein